MENSLIFYPERFLKTGAGILCASVLLSLPFWWNFENRPLSQGLPVKEEKIVPVFFSLGSKWQHPSFPLPRLESEMVLSFDPCRPGTEAFGVNVRLKKSGETKRCSLPCRLDLQYQGEKLVFSKTESPFWVELKEGSSDELEGKGMILSLEGEKIEGERFIATVGETPVHTGAEFQEGSPFRILAEAKWLGRDIIRKQFGDGLSADILEIGSQSIELIENEWLAWIDGRWEKSAMLVEKDVPIAKLKGLEGKNIRLEGWGTEGYVQLSLAPVAPSPNKTKTEELFSAIRVRSEKQISCMLEKQCMILKTGDWVVKKQGRWRVLRGGEEKKAFLEGKHLGELLVFEQIGVKGGQKVIQGHLFPTRTQGVLLEVPVQTMRKTARKEKTK